MNKEYHEVLKKYLFQMQNYTDNLLVEKLITEDEYLKIHEPLLALSNNLLILEPKEPEKSNAD